MAAAAGDPAPAPAPAPAEVEACEAALDCIWRAIKEEDESHGWEYWKESDGVRVFRNRRESLHVFRAHGRIRHPPEDVLAVCSLLERRPEWDPLCSGGRLLKRIDDAHALVWWSFYGLRPVISQREVLCTFGRRRLPGGAWVVGSAEADLPDVPVEPGHIRSQVIIAGLVLDPVPPDGAGGSEAQHTLVHYVACVDPRGLLPHFAVNLGAGKGAWCIDSLRAKLGGDDGPKSSS